MKSLFHTRQGIPFYFDKTETDFRQDPYERYNEMVIRQTALHLADEVWGHYPFQIVLDWVLKSLPPHSAAHIAELGCGVGRLIGTVAQTAPKATCWGIDYSYQMLRRAREYWIEGKTLELDWSARGFAKRQIIGQPVSNLQLALTKAEALPFDTAVLDLVYSSFLLDRLDDPAMAMEEMYRVLKPQGTLLLLSPLNFQKAKHWQFFYPAEQIIVFLESLGFQVTYFNPRKNIREPLDARGNALEWQCMALVAQKGG